MAPPKLKKPKPKPKPAPKPVQSAGVGMMFSKDSFFIPKRGPDGGKVAIPKVEEVQPFGNNRFPSKFQPQRHFIYDKVTNEAYAEWVDGSAVCIHTGNVLFRSRRVEQDDGFMQEDNGFAFKPDYSAPKQQHPNDYSISTNEILASGFITVHDFKEPNGAAIRLVDYEAYLKTKKEQDEQQ